MKFDRDDPVLSIDLVAHKTGLPESTIRNYNLAGVLFPRDNESGNGYYSISDLEHINFINRLSNEGLDLINIQHLFNLIPCWKSITCTDQLKKNCAAYDDYRKLCWIFINTYCRDPKKSCKECKVYEEGCTAIGDLKLLIENSKSNQVHVSK
ncbi:MerR family transcriptional regulator [candidate division KSB1 bacterium]|nr:MerR family transcriptional regulator [candidate division KSB1 bacterium]